MAERLVPFEEQDFFKNSAKMLSDEDLLAMNLKVEKSSHLGQREKLIKIEKQEFLQSKSSEETPFKGFDYHLRGTGGSNAFAVHGKHTKSGKSLFSGDPHLENKMPSFWYMMSIEDEESYFTGFSMSGIPGPLFGKGPNLAFSPTVFISENYDFYQEQLNPDMIHYYHGGEWKQLGIQNETIKIHGKESFNLTVRSTHHGPLLSELRGRGAAIIE